MNDSDNICYDSLNFEQNIIRPCDVQFPIYINKFLFIIWIILSSIGLAMVFFAKQAVVGAIIVGIPTLIGMFLKPTFGLCVFSIVLSTGGGVGGAYLFSLERGVGLILAATFLLNIIVSKPTLEISAFFYFYLLFVIWIFLASLNSVVLAQEIRSSFVYVQLLILTLIVYWILISNGYESLIWVLRSYVFGSIGTMCLAIITGTAMQTVQDTGQDRLAGTVGNAIDANMLATLLGLGVLCSIFLVLHEKNTFWKLFALVGILMLPIMMLKTGSRGGMIALMITLALTIVNIKQLIYKPKVIFSFIFLMLIAVVFIGIYVAKKGLTEGVSGRFSDIAYAKESFVYRLDIIEKTISGFNQRPFGTGHFGWLYQQGFKHYPHNDFFYCLGVYGFPGALLFLFLLFILFKNYKKIPFSYEKILAQSFFWFLVIVGLNIGQIAKKHYWFFMVLIIAIYKIMYGKSLMKHTGKHEF